VLSWPDWLNGAGAAAVVLAYAIGCVATGYYLVRWRTGWDVRAHGTGSSGATNAARVLGKPAFALVFAVDLAKGALAVALARWLSDDAAVTSLAAVAVTAGHVWPAQLGFRGGKGIATAWGAAWVYAPVVALLAAAAAGVAFLAGTRFVLSGLIAVAAAPLIAAALGVSGPVLAGIAAQAVLVLVAHRDNIAGMMTSSESWRRTGGGRTLRSAPGPFDGSPS
jgi:acyl phosphate:glycerol-3-phosphate acyltransferase